MDKNFNPHSILYQDEHLIVVNKPAGIPVHRSSMTASADRFLLQELRNQVGRKVFPVHRLDSKTSGIVLFTFSPQACAEFQETLHDAATQKIYITVTRGYVPEYGVIDYAIKNERGNRKDAITHFQRLNKTEKPWPIGRYDGSRYSLVLVLPKTGRFHQIRLHFSHLRHPIIGDNKHGDLHHNHFFRDNLDCPHLLLHALGMKLTHPISRKHLTLQAPLPIHFDKTLQHLGFDLKEHEVRAIFDQSSGD